MSRAEPALRPVPPASDRASARDRTERQLAMLTRLAEIGIEIAEAAGRRARALAEGGAAGADWPDPGLTYARAARAVRLTIALQSKLAGDLAASSRAEAARRRDRIHIRIERTAETEHADADAVEHLSSAAWEQLAETDDADLLDRPIEEVVARICADLGLSPAFADSAFRDSPRSLAPSVGFAASSPAAQGRRRNARPCSPVPQRTGELSAKPTEGAYPALGPLTG